MEQPIRFVREKLSIEGVVSHRFEVAGRRAFGRDTAFEPTVRESKHADYQVNGALRLAKELGRPARDVAAEVVASLSSADDVLDRTEIAGPGFINVWISARFLERVLTRIWYDGPLVGAAYRFPR
jgi:arginyl-tRNA synthetase